MGYYYVRPDTFNSNRSIAGSISGVLHGPALSVDKANATLKPLEDKLRGSALGSDKIYVTKAMALQDDFAKWWSQTNAPLVGGYSLRLGSRLWGKAALTGDTGKLESVLRQTTPPPQELDGNFVGGPGTRSPRGGIAGGDNAVLPGWRQTYVEISKCITVPTH